MTFTEDLAAYLADFGEAVTIDGAARTAIFDTGAQLLLGGEVLGEAPSLLVQSASVPAAAQGQACVVRSVSYRIREVRAEPPDGALTRLVLVRG